MFLSNSNSAKKLLRKASQLIQACKDDVVQIKYIVDVKMLKMCFTQYSLFHISTIAVKV